MRCDWIRVLCLGFTNPVGNRVMLNVCLCLGCGGVGGCCFPYRDLWKEWGDSNSDLFRELPVPPQAAGVVGTLDCAFHNHS